MTLKLTEYTNPQDMLNLAAGQFNCARDLGLKTGDPNSPSVKECVSRGLSYVRQHAEMVKPTP